MAWFKSKKKREDEKYDQMQAAIRDKSVAKSERAKVAAALEKSKKKLEESVLKAAEAKRASNAMLYKQYSMTIKVELNKKKALERTLGQMDVVSAMGDMNAACKEINESMNIVMNGAGKFLTDPAARRDFEESMIKMSTDMEMQEQHIEEWKMQMDSIMPNVSNDVIGSLELDPEVEALINAQYGSFGTSDSPAKSKGFYDDDLQDALDRLNKMNK